MFDSDKISLTVRGFQLKKLTIVSLLIALCAVLPNDAQAQKGTVITKAVRFAKGKSSATVKGTAQAFTSYAYTLRAKEGQEMTVSVSSPNDNVRFTVFSPGGLGAFSGEKDLTVWTDMLPKNGIYKIMVFSTSDVGASAFTLKVSVK